MSTFPRLALVDWGIGGLGVRRALRSVAPGVPVAYWSDTGAVPYGKLSHAELVSRLDHVVRALADRGAHEVFLACNAASTVLASTPRFALPTRGMIDPALACVSASGARAVGVVGGARTIRSGVLGRSLRSSGVRVAQRIAQPLSAAIEAGDADSETTRALVRRIVAPLRAESLDALLLACTHYPAASAAFREALPQVMLLDPANEAAEMLRGAAGSACGADVVFTTGNAEAMRRSAQLAFGEALETIVPIRMER